MVVKKNGLIRWVALFLLVLLPAAGVRAASIVGSRHDLSALYRVPDSSGRGLAHDDWNIYADYGEVCVYCHTPHHADQTQGPLWNRPAYTTSYTLYESPTLHSQPGQPGKASLLCLSCHDGTIAVDTVLNLPGSGLQFDWYNPNWGIPAYHSFMKEDTIQFHGDNTCYTCHGGSAPSGINLEPALIGTTLNDEHPIAIAYPPAGTAGFFPAPSGGKFPNGVSLVDGKVECISCHDVHDPTHSPFLITSNDRSALCLTCHDK